LKNRDFCNYKCYLPVSARQVLAADCRSSINVAIIGLCEYYSQPTHLNGSLFMAEQQPKPEQQPKRNPWLDANILFLALAFFIFYYLSNYALVDKPEMISYSDFKQQVRDGRVAKVQLKGLRVQGVYRGGTADSEANKVDFKTTLPLVEDSHILELFKENNVRVEVRADETPLWVQLMVGFLPWLFILGLFVYSGRMLRSRMAGNGSAGGMFSFGQSRARRFESSTDGPRFEDVAGLDNAKQDLWEIIDYLKNPERYGKLGAKMPKGILMMGPPGTGKTLLAKATAAEAGVPFFSVSGSEFIEMYVGVGASRVRDMFAKARKEAPALIFIDEIDSVGRVRGTGLGGGNDEREQTLNQILAEMDGFDPEEAVVVLAATNRPDVLDPALLRPGRFDRKVILDLPQKKARRAILAVHTRKTPLDADVDLDAVASATVGFSGADIENLVNEARLRAARHKRETVSQEDFSASRDRVMMGARRDDLLNESERGRIAAHEAGHALTAHHCLLSDPLEKVSIVPRGQALGMTEQLPREDRHNVDEDYLQERLSILLGGRAAEILLYGNVSSGAADDLKQATRLARKMVAQWGMSRRVGPVGYRVGEEHPFLGRELTEPKDYSERTAELLDEEIRLLLQKAERKTFHLLKEHRNMLERLIAELLEHESLDRKQLELLLAESEELPN
jgi:cell division protease FtsH